MIGLALFGRPSAFREKPRFLWQTSKGNGVEEMASAGGNERVKRRRSDGGCLNIGYRTAISTIIRWFASKILERLFCPEDWNPRVCAFVPSFCRRDASRDSPDIHDALAILR